MTKHTSTQQTRLYIIFWVIILGLVVLIGWFVYIFIRPETTTDTIGVTNQKNTVITANENTINKQKKKKNNTNTAVTVNATIVDNENTNDTKTATTNNSNEGGLVEPSNANSNTTNNTNEAETKDADGTKTVTLYFPKADSACGTVYPVERAIEPTDDIYGQIILEDMYGPTTDESDYDNAITANIGLRQVEYTADGPLITLNEGYNELTECQQATVDAQLIKTANAMFELPEDTAGQVVVGTVTETDSNTNSEDTTNTSDRE